MPGLLHSELLSEAGFRHAFFTRAGGVSTGPFAELNFSIAVGDDPSAVESNFRRAAAALAVSRDRLYFLSQVHGADVLELHGDETASEVLTKNADALVSGQPDLACAVRTADCVPILIGDTLTGRVAAIHAGWRGLVGKVIGSAAKQLGGSPRTWVAAIGPHIGADSFEVSEDVARELEGACPGAHCTRREPEKKPYVDLACVTRRQLEQLGVERERIELVRGDTFADPTRFFSFRRDGARSGRHLSAIVPKLSR